MTKVRNTQHACAGCRRRFAEPQPNRRGTLCEDCQAAEDRAR